MKKSPETARLEEILRSAPIYAGGMLGTDGRSLPEIIAADAAELARLGFSTKKLVARMHEITDKAIAGLSTYVEIEPGLVAIASDTRGRAPCPWPHAGHVNKTVITVANKTKDIEISWSLLGLHMIEEHGFFQGRGARFRLDPAELIRALF